MTTAPKRRWIEPPFVEPSAPLIGVAGHPLVARILVRRGLEAPAAARAFLDPDAYAPAASSELPDLPAAAARLRDAIQRGERILIWGDFDVDGQTSTALLSSALKRLGADARPYIPHRLHEGHGIKLPSLQKNLPGVDLLLTCDTGVAEHKAIAFARNAGVTVIITDHHDLPPELPQADAVVDPKRLAPGHPLYELPGVGVAYKLTQELQRLTGQPLEGADPALDLVALGIVADVATQTGDTRYLLQRGMAQLRQTDRVGLQALMQQANIRPTHLTTDHIGFGLGPRLNALGRLGDANLAVELLTTDDVSRARILAAQLEGLNGRRRLLTEQIYAAAQEQIAQDPTLLDDQALVLGGPRWHPGVVGIVASRLAELYGRPTVLISEGEDGIGRGSARSVPGVDVHAAITAVESLLLGHGGHPGAAGLSLAADRIAQFRRSLSREVEAIWDRTVLLGLNIDAVLEWNEPSLALVEILDGLAPFGEGNPPVMIMTSGLELASEQVFGRDRTHRRLTVRDKSNTAREVVWWRGAEHPLPTGTFDLAYLLKASDYRGERSLQIEYVDARIVSAPPAIDLIPAVRMIDHRKATDAIRVLDDLRVAGDVAVWAEGYPPARSPGAPRHQLQPAPSLAVWTSPPGQREWQAVLERVMPESVYLFSVPGEATDPSRFLPRLAGLIKHTVRHKHGAADLEQLAAASAQRVETVRTGIHLLAARGDVKIVDEKTTTMRLAAGDGDTSPEIEAAAGRLQVLLAETAAYRTFFGRTEAEQLIRKD